MKDSMRTKLHIPIVLFLFVQLGVAQKMGEEITTHSNARDKLYVEETVGFKRPMQPDHLRQANISWEKRVWRSIDLREKMNQHFMFPVYETQNRIALLDLIKKGIESGELVLFDDDEFNRELSSEQALSRFSREVTIAIVDSFGNWVRDSVVQEIFTPDKITQYKIKEDWYFDKERGVQEVRILGICPVYYDENKDLYIDKGWVYFPQARNLFVKYKTFNPKNDAAVVSFDEIFQKRFFSSYIQKESNVYDRYISQYTAGIESLCEAERVKGEIYKWEHDLWNF
jgi:gliding motility associated protien GldN